LSRNSPLTERTKSYCTTLLVKEGCWFFWVLSSLC